MVYIAKEYVTPEEYAVLCGVTNQTVFDRIKRREISGHKINGFYCINIISNPPTHSMRGRKANIKRPIPEKYSYSDNEIRKQVPMHNLRGVGQIARDLKITADKIFERILMGEIDAFMICGKALIDITVYPPQSFK